MIETVHPRIIVPEQPIHRYKFEEIVSLTGLDVVGYEILSKKQQDDWFEHDINTINLIGEIDAHLEGIACINLTSEVIVAVPDCMISRATFYQPNLVIEWVETGCSAHTLFQAAEVLKRWRRDFNIRISIDDMGKGQDGLERFLLVMPDIAKIEGSLLHGARRHASHRRALDFLCRFCLDEGVPAVVEWIETKEDLEIARDAGGTYGQGYLFKKPS